MSSAMERHIKSKTRILSQMKKKEEKITILTANDYWLSQIVDNAGIDVMLPGSFNTTQLYENAGNLLVNI